MAPPAGHIDDHGSPEQAAVDEVREEVGLNLTTSQLAKTAITGRHIENICRRPGGTHHEWTVFEASVGDEKMYPDPDETEGAIWIDMLSLRALAERGRQYRAGTIADDDWNNSPGLEPVWIDFLEETGHIKG